jgi:hypothetical protein
MSVNAALSHELLLAVAEVLEHRGRERADEDERLWWLAPERADEDEGAIWFF